MRDLEGTALVIADSSSDYAAVVVDLLSDPERREQLRLGAARAVKELFSPEVCYEELIDAMRAGCLLNPSPSSYDARLS